MQLDTYDFLIKKHAGFSQKELQEMLIEAIQKQGARLDGNTSAESIPENDDTTDAELLLKLTADLIGNGIAVPECLRHWVKAIIDEVAEGNDPKTIAYMQKPQTRGHRPSHDEKFLKNNGTSKEYRIAAIIKLLQIADHTKTKAVDIVRAALLGANAPDRGIWRAAELWEERSLSVADDAEGAAYLHHIAMGNDKEPGEELEKVLEFLQTSGQHSSKERLENLLTN